MWTLKDEAEGATKLENAKKMKEILEALADKIDFLNHIEVSYDVFESVPGCDVILFTEFDDKEKLNAYAIHPLHLECVDFIKKVVTSRSAVDYVI
jgi:hypothetical protein